MADKKKKSRLIPPDLKRCQAEKLSGSFMTLGPRHLIRCEKEALYVCKENNPGEGGKKGSMSLCHECLGIMRKMMGDNYATVVPVAKWIIDKKHIIIPDQEGGSCCLTVPDTARLVVKEVTGITQVGWFSQTSRWWLVLSRETQNGTKMPNGQYCSLSIGNIVSWKEISE